jgi:cytochrome c556
MIRTLAIVLLASAAGACTIPTYEPEPVSVYQWERRQETIQRRQAERERLCHITREDDPRKEELCRGVSGARQ